MGKCRYAKPLGCSVDSASPELPKVLRYKEYLLYRIDYTQQRIPVCIYIYDLKAYSLTKDLLKLWEGC